MTTQNTAPTFVLNNGIVTVVPAQYNLISGSNGKFYTSGFNNISRYNNDGSLDASFGSDGQIITEITDSNSNKTLVYQSDGKILVSGTVIDSVSGKRVFGVIRYNIDGNLDNSFGENGRATTNIDIAGDYALSMALQTDNKILVSGQSYDSHKGLSNIALVRLNSNGSLDNSFDGDGKVSTSISSDNDIGYCLAVQTDGKILVGGSSANILALVRYNSDGSLDKSFDNDGKLITEINNKANTDSNSTWGTAFSIVLQKDNKILVAGNTRGNGFVLIRYNPDGGLDNSFDGDGILTDMKFGVNTSLYAKNSFVLQADGKILIRVTDFANKTDAIVRYNSNGTLDDSFYVKTGIINSSNLIFSQEDGKILISGIGEKGSTSNGYLTRYNANGSVDTTFSSSKNTLTSNPIYNENESSIVLDSNVQIYDQELALINNYFGSSITLSRHDIANSQDIFSAKTGGTLTPLVGNSYFAVDGITIGRVTTNDKGIISLLFGANASQSLVNRAIQQIAYSNTSDAPPESVQMDWIFNDGNSGKQGSGGALSSIGNTTIKIIASNDRPFFTSLIPDQSIKADLPFSYTIPNNIYFDPDLIDVLTFSFKMVDGTAIPPWLSFNSDTHTFSGIPSVQDIGTYYDIQVIVDDALGSNSQPNKGFAAGDLLDLPGGVTSGKNYFDTFRISVLSSNSPTTGSVTIAGTAIQNKTLTASNTLADTDGLGVITYQWLRDDVAITNATQSTYTLTQTDVGKKISVKAGYTDNAGTSESVISIATSSVTNVNDTPKGNVTISGTANQNQILTANNTLTDLDGLGTITYQWLSNNKEISNSTQSTYKLAQSDVGNVISVKASYTDGFGSKETVTSAATAKIENVNDAPTGNVSISGLAAQGQTLTIVNTLADLDGLGTIKYQWLSNGAALSGATKTSYVLSSSDIGKTISVKASYTDLLGTSESVTSQSSDAVISTKPSKGNDVLTGTAKNDTLSALAGNDILTGGLGADKLTGGLGADIFKYVSIGDSGITTKTRDTITDFKHSEGDKIDLSAIVLPSDQSFTYIGTIAFSNDATAQLRLDPKTGLLYGSTNADNIPEFSILLSGVKSLVPEDFIL
jgi:uncharacterized delta-60 repeat protein